MFCCRVSSCSWVVNWHIILDTVGLRSERLPCPETAARHSVQKTSKWGLITRPCWILPSYSAFVLVVSVKSPNYTAEAFLSCSCFIELCQASETDAWKPTLFLQGIARKTVYRLIWAWPDLPLLSMTKVNNCVRALEFMLEAECACIRLGAFHCPQANLCVRFLLISQVSSGLYL